jgi:hypothetical protein
VFTSSRTPRRLSRPALLWKARFLVAAGALALSLLPVAGMLLGSSGPAVATESTWVTRTQVRLNDLGCDAGRAHGQITKRVRAATIRFESANQMRQDGRLDPRTRKRLHANSARRCDDRPLPARSGTGRRIVVSQSQNWVWLVRANGRIVAQGGIVDNDWLPRRTYTVGAQCGRPARSEHRTDESGTLRIDYFTRFYCRVGFHEIPVRFSTGKPVHPVWYAGTDLAESRGCIRLPRPLARATYRFTALPTKVVVR